MSRRVREGGGRDRDMQKKKEETGSKDMRGGITGRIDRTEQEKRKRERKRREQQKAERKIER